MKIAVVGTGISGLVAGWLLQREHEVTVFEALDRVGGHTNTVEVELQGRHFAVDTGFIVHNVRTYPNLARIFEELGVVTKPTTMSFSVREEATGLEYSSQAILARRRNALSPRVLRTAREIVRFNAEAQRLLEQAGEQLTLGELLQTRRYSQAFIDLYIVPMGAAIWSTDPARMMFFPARTFLRFLINHGLTSLIDRPTWRVVEGGSREYVGRLTRAFAGRIRTRSPVLRIHRHEHDVELTVRGCPPEHFDRVVIAAHSDQALQMLADPSDAERQILGAMPYQTNEAVLHTDESLLPRHRRAWASWNYQVPAAPRERVVVTYDMNALQGISNAPATFCVSLNAGDRIDPSKVLYRTRYDHPLFTAEAVAAQRRIDEISGSRHTYYCGAYWRYGFHEDGVVSALAVARKFGMGLASTCPDPVTQSEAAA
ncbi:MAG: FAD-dependent oxidoreductase [Polyangiales bacterium]